MAGAPPQGSAVSGVAAVIIGVPALKLRGYYLAMATLGFGIIVFIVLKEARGLTGGPSGLTGIPSLSVGGFSFNTPWRLFLLIWPLLGVMLAVSANIVNSRVGRALRALHDSEAAAQSLGVNVPRLKLMIFVWSALFFHASLAGSLYAHTLNFIAPAFLGFMFSIKLVTMVVVGGLASIWGSLLGAAVLTVLPEALGYLAVSLEALDHLGINLEALCRALDLPAPRELPGLCHDLEVVIFGAILMVVMIFLPRGLVRGTTDLWEFRRYKREGGALPFN